MIQRLRLPLFLAASFVVTFLQAARVTPMLDWSYIAEVAYRYRLGFHFYRDLDVVLPPGTFVIQSLLLGLPIPFSLAQLIYSAVQTGLTAYFCYEVFGRLTRDRALKVVALLLLLCHGVAYPYPFYDYDVAFSVSLYLFVFTSDYRGRSILLGALAWLPLCFKQSAGLGFLVAAHSLLALRILSRRSTRSEWRTLALGSLTGGAAFVTLVGHASAWANVERIVRWTWVLPAQLRGSMLKNILQDFSRKSILLAVLAYGLTRIESRLGRATAFAPFLLLIPAFSHATDLGKLVQNVGLLWAITMVIGVVACLTRLRAERSIVASSEFFVFGLISSVAVANSASQGLSGSTYAFGPLLIAFFGALSRLVQTYARRWTIHLAITFAIILALNQVQNARMNVYLHHEQPTAHATHPALRWLTASGPYLSNLDQLITFVRDEIPEGDRIHVLPGEDPFYLATGRRPALPFFQMIRVVFPYEPEDILKALIEQDVKWVICKTDIQVLGDFYRYDETKNLLLRRYELARTLSGYEVYRLDARSTGRQAL